MQQYDPLDLCGDFHEAKGAMGRLAESLLTEHATTLLASYGIVTRRGTRGTIDPVPTVEVTCLGREYALYPEADYSVRVISPVRSGSVILVAARLDKPNLPPVAVGKLVDTRQGRSAGFVLKKPGATSPHDIHGYLMAGADSILALLRDHLLAAECKHAGQALRQD